MSGHGHVRTWILTRSCEHGHTGLRSRICHDKVNRHPFVERSAMSVPAGSESRVAGAPISWGVCEVPGWGLQLPADRVLAEMRELGLRATEFGPDGFLPDEPAEKAASSSGTGCGRSAGSSPCCCTTPPTTRCPEVDAYIDGCLAAGAGMVVLAASTGGDGYDVRPVLDDVRLADPAGQPRPALRPRRDPGRGRRPAPARGHDGRGRRRRATRPRRVAHRALRRHRPPRGRGRRPGRDHRAPTPTGSDTCTSRTSTPTWPPAWWPARSRSPTPSASGLWTVLGEG